jgi:hypothetical protein
MHQQTNALLHRLRTARGIRPWLFGGLAAVVLLSLVSVVLLLRHTSITALPPPRGLSPLPGQQQWLNGTSSYLFGTNDSYEWSSLNIETQPAIQAALRTAGFTLLRTFFPDGATDVVIDQRIETITNSGAECLGVITDTADTAFDEHLVQYLGDRCDLYEFGNEPDYSHDSAETYLKQWNTLVPRLRRINPSAKFIGPVTSSGTGVHDFMQTYLNGVKASGVLPDAISFHYYPCFNDGQADCLAKAGSFADATYTVRSMVKATLGKELPVGITEWNYDPGNPPPAYGDDASFISDFTMAAIHAMATAGVTFACQFDAASYGGYGRLDMFDVTSAQPKPQYTALKQLIAAYRPT